MTEITEERAKALSQPGVIRGSHLDRIVVGPFRPKQHPSVVARRLGDEMVVLHPDTARSLSFDAITAVLWDQLDGSTSLESLATDLVVTLGMPDDYAETMVTKLAKVLAIEGFLEWPRVEANLVRPEWIPIPADSCAGKKLGLSQAQTFTAALAGHPGGRTDPPIRIGATRTDVATWLRTIVEPDLVDSDEPGPHLVANVHRMEDDLYFTDSKVRRGVRIRHRLVDEGGNFVTSSYEPEAIATAAARWIADRRAQRDGGVWLRLPVLVRDDAMVLAYPSMGGTVERSARRLRAQGVRVHESPVVHIDPASATVQVHDNPHVFPGTSDGEITPGGTYRIAALMGPGLDLDPLEKIRGFSQVMVVRDKEHLDGVAELTERVPYRGSKRSWGLPEAVAAMVAAFDA